MNNFISSILTILLSYIMITFYGYPKKHLDHSPITQPKTVEYHFTLHEPILLDINLREELELITSKEPRQPPLAALILKHHRGETNDMTYEQYIITGGKELDKKSYHIAYRLGYQVIQRNHNPILHTLFQWLIQNPQKEIHDLAFNHPICSEWHYLLSIIYPEGNIQLDEQECEPEVLTWLPYSMIMQYLDQKRIQITKNCESKQKILDLFTANTATQLSYLQEENKALHRKLSQIEKVLNQATWSLTFIPTQTLRCSTKSAAFSSNGQLLASTDYDEVHIYNATNYHLLTELQGNTWAIRSMIFSSDGKHLATASKTVRIYNATSFELLKELKEEISWVHMITFSPEGQYLAVVDDLVTHIYDTTNYQLIKKLEDYQEPFRSVAFSPDGTHLALGSKNHMIYIYDTTNYQLIKKVDHIGHVWRIVFSLDENLLATKSGDGSVRIYDTINYQLLQVIKQKDELTSLAFSPDSQLLAIGSESGHIYLYNITTYQLLKTLQRHIDSVWSLNFSPDGKKLVSSSLDRTFQVWDSISLPSIKKLKGLLNKKK